LFFVSNYSGQERDSSVSREAAKAAKKSVCSQENFAALRDNNPVSWFFFRS